MRLAALMFAIAALPAAAQYSVERNGDVVQLSDTAAQTVVSVLPPAGNIAFEMKVKGVNVLRFPYASVEQLRGRKINLRFKSCPGVHEWKVWRYSLADTVPLLFR